MCGVWLVHNNIDSVRRCRLRCVSACAARQVPALRTLCILCLCVCMLTLNRFGHRPNHIITSAISLFICIVFVVEEL